MDVFLDLRLWGGLIGGGRLGHGAVPIKSAQGDARRRMTSAGQIIPANFPEERIVGSRSAARCRKWGGS